jgi:hypothetical protein
VIIAAVLFYADWKLGWDVTKPYTAPACVAYFALNGLLTYWIFAVESNEVFTGVREGGQRVRFMSTALYNSLNLTIAHPTLLHEKAFSRLQTESDILCSGIGQKMGRQRGHRPIHSVVQHPRVLPKEGISPMADQQHRCVADSTGGARQKGEDYRTDSSSDAGDTN